MDFVICEYAGNCYGNRFYMLLLLLPVIIISSIDSYKYMSYLSIPSIILAITGMLTIFYFSIDKMSQGVTS